MGIWVKLKVLLELLAADAEEDIVSALSSSVVELGSKIEYDLVIAKVTSFFIAVEVGIRLVVNLNSS